jgi:hypothetical protein
MTAWPIFNWKYQDTSRFHSLMASSSGFFVVGRMYPCRSPKVVWSHFFVSLVFISFDFLWRCEMAVNCSSLGILLAPLGIGIVAPSLAALSASFLPGIPSCPAMYIEEIIPGIHKH